MLVRVFTAGSTSKITKGTCSVYFRFHTELTSLVFKVVECISF